MGPGIFTKYSKQVISGILAAFLLFGAVVLYYRFRSPVRGRSPYETVNDMYEWEYMTFTAEQERYSPDVEKIRLTFRNDAPDGVSLLATWLWTLKVWPALLPLFASAMPSLVAPKQTPKTTANSITNTSTFNQA